MKSEQARLSDQHELRLSGQPRSNIKGGVAHASRRSPSAPSVGRSFVSRLPPAHAYLALSLLVCGCGDDSGSAAALDGATFLGDLDSSERHAFCQSVEAQQAKFFAALVPVACTQQARAASADSCMQQRAQCIAHGSSSAFDCSAQAFPTDCHITVQQYRDCFGAALSKLEQVSQDYTCTAGEDEVNAPLYSASCMALQSQCPGGFITMDDLTP